MSKGKQSQWRTTLRQQSTEKVRQCLSVDTGTDCVRDSGPSWFLARLIQGLLWKGLKMTTPLCFLHTDLRENQPILLQFTMSPDMPSGRLWRIGKTSLLKSMCSDQGFPFILNGTAGFLALAPHFVEDDVVAKESLQGKQSLESCAHDHTRPLVPVLPGGTLK